MYGHGVSCPSEDLEYAKLILFSINCKPPISGWEEASDCHFSGASSAYILGSNNQGLEAEARLVGNLDIREEGVLVETLEWK